ncbi:MAG: sec-independent protein translocase protein TatA [Thermoproteota archaeon]|nr:sec-independent protein translocase protein TatA [Thermoproteota archaeon]
MIEGWEWIAILLVGAAILLWGPKKIPELARGLGQARGEFSKASKEYVDAAKNAASLDSKGGTSTEKNDSVSSDDTLIETAKKLGINTVGKTRAEISKEIVDKYGFEKKNAF